MENHGQKLGILLDFNGFGVLYLDTSFSKQCGFHVGSIRCGEKNLMSFPPQKKMLDQFGIASMDVGCETAKKIQSAASKCVPRAGCAGGQSLRSETQLGSDELALVYHGLFLVGVNLRIFHGFNDLELHIFYIQGTVS